MEYIQPSHVKRITSSPSMYTWLKSWLLFGAADGGGETEATVEWVNQKVRIPLLIFFAPITVTFYLDIFICYQRKHFKIK